MLKHFYSTKNYHSPYNLYYNYIYILVLTIVFELLHPSSGLANNDQCNLQKLLAKKPRLSHYRIYRKILMKEYDSDNKLIQNRSVSTVELMDPFTGWRVDVLYDHFTEDKFKVAPFVLPYWDLNSSAIGYNYLKNNLKHFKTGLKEKLTPNEKVFKLKNMRFILDLKSCQIKSLETFFPDKATLISNYSTKVNYLPDLPNLPNLFIPEDVVITYQRRHWIFFKRKFIIHMSTHIVDDGIKLDERFIPKPNIIYRRKNM